MRKTVILYPIFALILVLATKGVAHAKCCECENPQRFSVRADHSTGIKQSWNLVNLSPTVIGSQFEQTQANQHFGYSFGEIPFLCNPVLVIEARPLAGNSDNDNIHLQVKGTGYRWGSRIEALVGGDWDSTDVTGWQTLTLVLSDLGGIDLSVDLVTSRLDVFIQDDTAVRSLTLMGSRCPGPGVSETSCCGDGAIGWANSSHLFGLHTDGNIKRAFYEGGSTAQWIQTPGDFPIVPGSFETLDDTTVLVVNDAGQVIKISPSASAVIPNTIRVHPCSLVVTKRGIFGVREDNGHVVLIDRDSGEEQSVAPWGTAHWPVETSLIEIGDGRVAGVTQHDFPWNIWFDGNGVMQWATIGEIGVVVH